MIQRIQSFYLALTTILSLLFLDGGILSFINNSGSVIQVTFRGVLENNGTDNSEMILSALPLTVIIVVIPLLAITTMLLFKKRKIQLKFAVAGIIFSALFILLLIYYAVNICSEYSASVTPGLLMAVPVIILIFNVLAYRGIKKDDNLVKSYDRLR